MANTTDTVFVILCTLLVWTMTGGLALFYGGLSKKKDISSIP
ncbi:ammonia channel protein AmtB [Weissella uvarum]|nr:ammonia channel protein AmtB [Weissella uvarum]